MPLKPRQHNDAVNHMYDSLISDGWTEEQVTQSIESMSEADRNRAFENAWKDSYESKTGGPSSGKVGAALAGASESFGFKLARPVAALVGGVKGLLTEFDPAKGAEEEWQNVEDRVAYHKITNPETYTLFNVAGYVAPQGLAGRTVSGLSKAASALGAGSKASAALVGGGSMLAQSIPERAVEGNLSAKGVATDVAIGAAAGPALIAGAKAVGSGGKSVISGLASLYAGSAKKYTNLMGGAGEVAESIMAKAPEIVKLKNEGIQLTRSKLAQQSDELLGAISTHLDDLKASVDVPEGEITSTAKEMQKFLTQGISEVSEGIAKQATSSKGLVKSNLKEAFTGLRAMGAVARKTVTDQYGTKVKTIEELGSKLSLSLSDDVAQFGTTLADANIVADNTGKILKGQVGNEAKEALQLIFKTANKPSLNWKEANDLKKLIGQSVDWDSPDPLNTAMKDLYTGIRSKLSESSKSLPTSINVDKLFGEYQSALQLANRYNKAFQGKNVDGSTFDMLPTTRTLKELANTAKHLTTLSPIDEIGQKALHKVVRLTARETQLSKLEDPFKLSQQLQKLTTSDYFSPQKFQQQFETVVGKVKDRQKIFDIAESWSLPKEAKDAIKVGGATFKSFMDNLPKPLQASKGALQQLHDRYQKSLRLNGYKPNEILETLGSEGALPPEVVADFRELLALRPEVQKFFETKNLLKLAQAPEAKLHANLTPGELLLKGGISYVIGGPKLAAIAGALERLHNGLKQPAAARLLAEKYKWVPSDKAAKFGDDVALLLNRVLPAAREDASSVITTQVDKYIPSLRNKL